MSRDKGKGWGGEGREGRRSSSSTIRARGKSPRADVEGGTKRRRDQLKEEKRKLNQRMEVQVKKDELWEEKKEGGKGG